MNKQIKACEVHDVLGKFMLADGYKVVVNPQLSFGSYMYDDLSESEFLDFFSFFASMPLGYNHPKFMEDDFVNEIGQVALHKISNSDCYTTTMAEFVSTMADVAMPDSMRKMFFISGGAFAVENALKTAFDWKVRKNLNRGCLEETGHKIIHFTDSFHGRSGYTLSLTNTHDVRKYLYFPRFEWPRIETPKMEFPLEGENLKRVVDAEKRALEKIISVCEKDGDDIAGLIIEPIQGEGGDNHFRTEFLRSLRHLADKYEFLLIFDEIQSGGGITGKMWAYEHHDVVPDIICFGKKFQVCGIMVGERVLGVERNCFEESSRINSTWGGNLVDMKRATRYLEIIREENLLENARIMGSLLLNGLEKLSFSYSSISNVRGRGLFVAFDMEDTASRNNLIQKCFEDENMIVIPCGELSVRFRPFLDVKEEEICEGLLRIERVLKKISQ